MRNRPPGAAETPWTISTFIIVTAHRSIRTAISGKVLDPEAASLYYAAFNNTG